MLYLYSVVNLRIFLFFFEYLVFSNLWFRSKGSFSGMQWRRHQMWRPNETTDHRAMWSEGVSPMDNRSMEGGKTLFTYHISPFCTKEQKKIHLVLKQVLQAQWSQLKSGRIGNSTGDRLRDIFILKDLRNGLSYPRLCWELRRHYLTSYANIKNVWRRKKNSTLFPALWGLYRTTHLCSWCKMFCFVFFYSVR